LQTPWAFDVLAPIELGLNELIVVRTRQKNRTSESIGFGSLLAAMPVRVLNVVALGSLTYAACH